MASSAGDAVSRYLINHRAAPIPSGKPFGPGTVANDYGPIGTLPSVDLGSNFHGGPGFNAPGQTTVRPPVTAVSQGWLAAPPQQPQAVGGGHTSTTFNLNSDPGVLGALAMQQQGLAQLDAQLKAQREQAIIQFGDPAFASQAGFGLDPQAGAFAQQNYLSGNATLARLDKQHKAARQQIIDRLAGKGLLFSGDTGYQEGQADSAYGNDVYDARQQVLKYLSDLYGGYLDRRQNLDQSVQQARLSAIQNYLSNPDAYAGVYG